MASSNDNEQLKTSERLGTIMADALREQLLNGPENMAQTAISSARGVDSDFDNLIFSNTIDDSKVTVTDDSCVSRETSLAATATSVINALNGLENDLSSACNQINTAIGINPSDFIDDNNSATVSASSTPIGQSQVPSPVTMDHNRRMSCKSGRHIMISYHHNSSYDVCRRMCIQLRNRGYQVWMDTNDLHGSIHEGMAEAIENSYIVLFCMNHQYFESEFCLKEALYADKRHIDFIPCLMGQGYEPIGWLGIIIRDKLYIDFSLPDKFDTAFEELVAEIQAIENRSQRSSIQTFILPPTENNQQNTAAINTSTTVTSVNHPISSDSLRAIIHDFRLSINQNNHDTQSMTEEEFSQFVRYIRRHVFPNTSSSPQTETNYSQEILQEILVQSRNQAEFLRKIAEILSHLSDTGPIIKLSLAFAFIWTINKFLKYT